MNPKALQLGGQFLNGLHKNTPEDNGLALGNQGLGLLNAMAELGGGGTGLNQLPHLIAVIGKIDLLNWLGVIQEVLKIL